MLGADETCLVTGGAGFIGSHVAEALVRRGNRVRVVDNLSTGRRTNLAHLTDRIELVIGSVSDPDVCRRVVEGVNIVFHVAALPSVPRSLADPWATHDANVNGTLQLLRACQTATVARFVYSGSSSVYGETPRLPKTESMEPLPRSPYAASKLAGEQYVLAFARAGIIEGIALRYFNVFGPRQDPHSQYAAVIPLFLESALHGTAVTLYGDGDQTRDFTYVDNVVTANMLAASRPASTISGSVVNVGAGEQTSLNELVALIGEVTGRHLKVEHKPPRVGDIRDSLASLQRAADVIGYRPLVKLDEGLRRTWEWTQRQTANSISTLSGPEYSSA
jgi:UDP-N-acetylglucosamine/UDP-N-acetyl-alpha-D-glucosaminouronate 4-epimerase